MNTVKVREIVLGEGVPKICVPIVGRTREEIQQRMEETLTSGPDLVEWRSDWYEEVFREERLEEILEFLREKLGEIPLLVTFRTGKEGGEQEISAEAYERFLNRVLDTGKADLIDIELFMGEELLAQTAASAREKGVKVVASSHDFQKTPEEEEILHRLIRMQELGADLLKIAVMPQNPGDVLRLLYATWEMKEHHAAQPLITMAMGGMGILSRLSGEVFGSCLTFGSAGQASAPGQMGVEELKTMLGILHKSL